MTWTPPTALRALRILWAALAVVGAIAVQGAADGRTPAAGTVAAVAWWVAVGVVVVALAVPGALGLAVVRMVAPLTVVASACALVLDAPAVKGGAMAALAVLTTALALSAETGEAVVQGAAYGEEVRLPLRPPAAVLPAVAASWLVWATAVTGAVLLLAAGRWVDGGAVAVVAAAATWWVLRGAARLCRRWLVLVPVGVVVHDPVVLAETLMVQRTNLSVVRLALADTQAADLTGPCGGHATEVCVRDMELAVLQPAPGRPKGGAIHVQSFLVAPSRPGRALRAMADRGLPVG